MPRLISQQAALPGAHLVAGWARQIGSRGGDGRMPGTSNYPYSPLNRKRYQPFFTNVGGGYSLPLFHTLEACAEWSALNPNWQISGVYDWSRRRWAPWPVVLEQEDVA